jgi:hypothetical protein
MAHVGKEYKANAAVVYIQGSVCRQRKLNTVYSASPQKKMCLPNTAVIART